MSGEMLFSLKDLYPNMAGRETSTDTQPEAEDRELLGDNGNAAGKVSTQARGRMMIVAIAALIGAVIIFGAN